MKNKKIKTKICLNCNNAFDPKKNYKTIKFCSRSCCGTYYFKKEITWKMNGECMECTSHQPNAQEYPRIYRNGKYWKISRYIYTQEHGEIPTGMIIRHTCDNPRCINIDHLIIGTKQDNANDKVERNRQIKGAQVASSKLTDQDIINIRNINLKHLKQISIARMYDISKSVVSNILNNKTWKHIK